VPERDASVPQLFRRLRGMATPSLQLRPGHLSPNELKSTLPYASRETSHVVSLALERLTGRLAGTVDVLNVCA
jgi:hypothetical protein